MSTAKDYCPTRHRTLEASLRSSGGHLKCGWRSACEGRQKQRRTDIPGPIAGDRLPVHLPACREDGELTDDEGMVYILIEAPLRCLDRGTCNKPCNLFWEFPDSWGFLFSTGYGKEILSISSSDTSLPETSLSSGNCGFGWSRWTFGAAPS